MSWKASLTTLLLVLFPVATLQAQLFVPDLPGGSTYHLAFLTDSTTGALKEFNAEYDAFVQADVASNALLSEIEWASLSTTIHLDAVSHLTLNGPIYRLDGVLIADNERDLFDGSIKAPLNLTPKGTTKDEFVWTGSGSNGRTVGCSAPGQASWECYLGNPDPQSDIKAGRSSATNGGWLNTEERRWTQMYPMYAFSMELTVPDSPSIPGDFNDDGQVNVADIDLLSAAIRSSSNDSKFDLNESGGVDMADADVLIVDILDTYYGDANLDGEFSSSDFVFTFVFGEYEDAVLGNSTWSEGDWNMDGDFNTGDLVFTFQAGGFEQGPRAAVSAVPEPATCLSFALGIGLISFGKIRRRQSV
jgi:hypothetical protein